MRNGNCRLNIMALEIVWNLLLEIWSLFGIWILEFA